MKKLYIETYGCQMNFSDSEIVAAIMTENNFETTSNIKESDVVFINTCSIRDNAEKRVMGRLKEMQSLRKQNPQLIIGVIGCMAERLKTQLLEEEKLGMRIDMVVGPDAYRDLPQLMIDVESGQKACNIILSKEETYADITPVKYSGNNVSAFISIMRGCENFCSYCVVPLTRGKERSRNPLTIISEARELFEKGYREITLLGQNVNSYNWDNGDVNFSKLLQEVAGISPLLRVRFATSHPKDISDELINVIASYNNICNAIHLPVQSGSTDVLRRMNRKYNREDYLERIQKIKSTISNCALSTDIIAGFCGETEEDHKETLSLMKEVGFDFAFMFKYSERPGTPAATKYKDDVPEKIKGRRLQEIIDLQQQLSLESNQNNIGKTFEVLVEGYSRKSKKQVSGRNSQNKVVVFEDKGYKPGDYVNVMITSCTAATLIGEGHSSNS
ncbi:MAG: tRNA (N6-isopentenyl adenosine(37)-C2)-methylthiotransferase MiaB [Bacteroidetes bacterium]|nr:tRNA (N6-isopentenyl adenosine(37)-C2)-methylthiotransferase MiaB [Bacteroidota bacterium]